MFNLGRENHEDEGKWSEEEPQEPRDAPEARPAACRVDDVDEGDERAGHEHLPRPDDAHLLHLSCLDVRYHPPDEPAGSERQDPGEDGQREGDEREDAHENRPAEDAGLLGGEEPPLEPLNLVVPHPVLQQHLSVLRRPPHKGLHPRVVLDPVKPDGEPLRERHVVRHGQPRALRHVDPPQRAEEMQRLHVLCQEGAGANTEHDELHNLPVRLLLVLLAPVLVLLHQRLADFDGVAEVNAHRAPELVRGEVVQPDGDDRDL
mmetsp:Transcript_33062/g.104538  ORF Transcript_33062/g.104538 Transcript_33062/m.104538 type:complete len:261 (+) Transcript_33062:1639-2421(+)